MDIDVPQAPRNSPFINYFDVSSNFPWQEPRPEQIRERRAAMLDGLLFDVLLMSGGIEEPYLVYPPDDPQSLQRLLDAIESSTYDTLKKDCLVYFLLKWHQDGRERTFEEQRCIPPQFVALSDAYWHLDTGINVPRAVALLSDARLNRDYASKIMHAISISSDSAALIRRYVQTAKPLLIEPLDIECYALALADSSVMEAWQFIRTFSEGDPMRARLLQKTLEWTVEPTPRPAALSQLLSLPLSTFEEDVFNAFVQKPTPSLKFSGVAILQDLMCVRLIQGGRYTEAIKLDRLFTSITLPRNLQLTKDRSKMVHDIFLALSSTERSMVELELDPNTRRRALLVSNPPSPVRKQAPAQAEEAGDLSLSQSWEDVRVPGIVSTQTTPLREVRVPATTTPKFGGPSNLRTSTSTPLGTPILPLNFNGNASTSKVAPRKSLPLSSSVLGMGGVNPRASLSGVGSRMAFGNGSPAIASPASGIRVALLGAGAPVAHSPRNGFVSASQQQNAFYKPPQQKTNGVKRAFEEDTHRSPERSDALDHDVDMDEGVVMRAGASLREGDPRSNGVDPEDTTPKSKGRRRGRVSAATEEPEEDDASVLQYSVFRASEEPTYPPPNSQPKSQSGRGRRKAPPGSFAPSDDDDAMDEDIEERKPRKTTRSRASAKETHAAPTKPPAKKARQIKAADLSRSIPGGFGDDDDVHDLEEEEEDQVAPLRAISPPRRGARKLRASMSLDSTADEGEGVQTRRRSSRLTMNGSAHDGSPEPGPAPKPKKATRTTKKKKN
ncbi:hypothetical protein HYPSUDRAFT_163737 [Hypholoma sublateritium FD-334 SS-4]|uniref:ELYS-like domain-containing protein n=1 Tax=Hypholoma sublateritium (strain FD-334 SS-4) TaxID=945553 RepID=A0A0D2L7K9_HYPSF|nr:hypothetical protein HYPSUDRAFT_163737 [Hypholoma sublateritium FD-334 SS-4]